MFHNIEFSHLSEIILLPHAICCQMKDTVDKKRTSYCLAQLNKTFKTLTDVSIFIPEEI